MAAARKVVVPPRQVRDKKTGKIRMKDAKRVRAGVKAWKARKVKKHSPATKKKISLGVKMAHRKKKTKAGRKLGPIGRPKGSVTKKRRTSKKKK